LRQFGAITKEFAEKELNFLYKKLLLEFPIHVRMRTDEKLIEIPL